MSRPNLEEKIIFLVASQNLQRVEFFTEAIKKHFSLSTIYHANDGGDCQFKIQNQAPHVLIIDVDLPKVNGIDLTQQLLIDKKIQDFSIIIVSSIPDTTHFADEVVTGKVQFLHQFDREEALVRCAVRALNRLAQVEDTEYHLRFLNKNEILFSQGEKGEMAYIVRKGELNVFRIAGTDKKLLSIIGLGEFVGEMAHINGQPRSATVVAKSECELIEIPFGSFDTILFSKPAWSKALVQSLSKRLKESNERK